MNMMSFSFWEKEENDLKDWAFNYVAAYRDEIKGPEGKFEGERVLPFLVINREPDFWWEIPGALGEVAENTEIESCTVAGPYCVDTDWLPENWGHECYVYQNYDCGEVDSGVEYAEGESINYVALRMGEFLENLKSGNSPVHRVAVGDLSPRQFAGLITYLAKSVDESLDITKNDFECGPFILCPTFDWIIDEIVDEEGVEDTNEIAERLVEKLDDFIDGLANATGDDVYCFFFQK